jgi:hypothetical protein
VAVISTRQLEKSISKVIDGRVIETDGRVVRAQLRDGPRLAAVIKDPPEVWFFVIALEELTGSPELFHEVATHKLNRNGHLAHMQLSPYSTGLYGLTIDACIHEEAVAPSVVRDVLYSIAGAYDAFVPDIHARFGGRRPE